MKSSPTKNSEFTPAQVVQTPTSGRFIVYPPRQIATARAEALPSDSAPLPPGGLPVTGLEPPLPVTVSPPPLADLPQLFADSPPAPMVGVELAETESSLWEKLRASPPFLISMAIHLGAVVALALLTLANAEVFPIEIFSGLGGTTELQDVGEPIAMHVIDELSAESLEPDAALSSALEGPAVTLPAPDELSSLLTEEPRIELRVPEVANSLKGRTAAKRAELVRTYGGTPETEAAVAKGLQWLQRRQADDGSWNTQGKFANPGNVNSRVAGTALALLAFQGAGHTHRKQGGEGPDYSEEVNRGWYALLALQQDNGSFQDNGLNMYAHAQATIALCELYGMTKDRNFRKPAERAIQFCVFAQSELGGWRYTPAVDADLSATGWYAMAFQSALMAGLDVPSTVFFKLDKYLDTVGVQDQSYYCYHPGRPFTHAMTAEGLLCRQYLGWKRDDPRMLKGAKYLLTYPPLFSRKNTYCWYYSTQVLHHLGGSEWERWNSKLRSELPRNQESKGEEAGSWNPSGDQWSNEGGRLYTTCLCLFMLEVYYRHLPIYNYGNL